MSSKHICTLHFKQSNFQRKLGELCLLPGTFPWSQILFPFGQHLPPHLSPGRPLCWPPVHSPHPTHPHSSDPSVEPRWVACSKDVGPRQGPGRDLLASPCVLVTLSRAHPAGDPPLKESPSPGPTTCVTRFEGYKILAPDIHVHLPLPRCKSAVVPNVFCPGGHQVSSGSSDL